MARPDISLLFPDVPVSLIVFGRSLNPKNIREGDDVYFECHVKANPPFYNITWRQNVSHFDYVTAADRK
jgi:hypothetical protein